MNEEIKALCRQLWQHHRGKVVGTFSGVFLAVAVLIIGFWKTIFIVLCGLVGLFFGTRADRGDRFTDFLEAIREAFPYGFHRWK